MAMSTSALALHQLLEEDSPESAAIRKFHYTALWRYRTGKRKPGVEIAAEIERLSGGRVPANGWEDLPGSEEPSHPPEAS